MNQQPSLEPDQAWFLWEKLNHFADLLWNAYQDDFVQRCLEETRFPRSSRRPIRSRRWGGRYSLLIQESG